MRVLIETIHIAVGLIAAAAIAWAAAWSYPRATNDIWLVAYACMVAVVAMGIGPLRKAYAIDRRHMTPTPGPRDDG
ncbi:hypothetical protein IAG41_14150 [Sphingomonas sp. JC676]|uniref:hypothetical protein n=1 Tax=Sphingomonas sp. JC676 TaxID=2768065 RepID=UPI001657E812|nr:hypothetical protein [Sphingomonas sp. JC676]MBC9033534.1 hypothetical protein [Sphingomonas sp. JC676]